MNNKTRATLKSGFTLIEVLVVVAIIALLAAILLPSLSKARAAARTTLCGSNQRQFGHAVTMWASENKGIIPRGTGFAKIAGYIEPVGTIQWTQLVIRALGIKGKAPNNYWKNYNHVPVDTFEVFQCPERTVTHEGRFLDYVVNALDHRGPINDNCAPSPTSGKWIEVYGVTKMNIWKRPSDVIYIMDAATEEENRNDNSTYGSLLKYGRVNIDFWRTIELLTQSSVPSSEPGPSLAYYDVFNPRHMPAYPQDHNTFAPRAALKMHGSGSNALFVDGHVELVKPPGRFSQTQVMQHYLVKWGVFDAVKNNITSTAMAGQDLSVKCRFGDPDYQP